MQLTRFLKRMNGQHIIRTAAYVRSSESLTHINWTLDALYHRYSKTDRDRAFDLFRHNNIPRMGMREIEQLAEEVAEFGPDLIICDSEPILANIAKAMDIKLWYCSPVHMLDGISWGYGQLKYTGALENTRKNLTRLPEAERVFVYSPFCDVEGSPVLKAGYEWVRPYHVSCSSSNNDVGVAVVTDHDRVSELSKMLNCVPPFCLTLFSHSTYDLSHLESINIADEARYQRVLNSCRWMFTTGETSFIADAIYGNINRLCIAPNLKDPETILNAILCEFYDFGDDVAQVEYLEKYSIEEMENSFVKSESKNGPNIIFSDIETLDEKVNSVHSV